MSRIEMLIATLDKMDDGPGWLSGDKELIAQLCRCVSEIGHRMIESQWRKAANESIPDYNEMVERKLTHKDLTPPPTKGE